MISRRSSIEIDPKLPPLIECYDVTKESLSFGL
jgi:hypothetical protein